MTELRIDGKPSARGDRTFVIAEIGVNHDGSRARAIELACVAAACGADAVKLQFFSPVTLMHASGAFAEYQGARGEAAIAGGDAARGTNCARATRGRSCASARPGAGAAGDAVFCRRTWRWWRGWGCRR